MRDARKTVCEQSVRLCGTPPELRKLFILEGDRSSILRTEARTLRWSVVGKTISVV
jgi:hypothetical protein